jgi:hypothetical protein
MAQPGEELGAARSTSRSHHAEASGTNCTWVRSCGASAARMTRVLAAHVDELAAHDANMATSGANMATPGANTPADDLQLDPGWKHVEHAATGAEQHRDPAR